MRHSSVERPPGRWRGARGDERQQLKWFAYGVALAVLSLFGNALAPDKAWLIGGTGTALLAGGIGLAILRYHLYDIDLIINRTLVYAALTGCVVGLYVVVVLYLGAVWQSSGGLTPSLIATGLVAVAFQPLREWLQRVVNGVLYGERDEPYRVLSGLAQRLGTALAPEAVLPSVVQTVAEALRLPYVAISLEQDGGLAVAASAGGAISDPVRLPLTYHGEAVGELHVCPRSPGEAFGPADRRLLDDVAHQAGVAVHAVRLTLDLRRSRERLVATREEERRRLRRDLHDGLGPALAAQTLKVGSARALLTRDPQGADRLLAALEEDIDAALTDIRRLVYNLRPPALDELGLVDALRQSLRAYARPPEDGAGRQVRITLDAPDCMPDLPAAVEVAAYRIAQEAVANVVRHARAATCTVRLVACAGGIELEVADDGIGLPPELRSGVGLTSMRERAEELGGWCRLEPKPPHGVRVLAWLPCSAMDAPHV